MLGFRRAVGCIPEVRRSPWAAVQKRFMGGAKKSMARARKLLVKKERKARRVEAIAKRPKDPILDKTVYEIPKTRMVWNIKNILAKAEGRVMASAQLMKMGRFLGISKGFSFPLFIRQFPAIFKYTKDIRDSRISWLEFTETADDMIDEEEKYKKEVFEHELVETIRKLLMMAYGHRISMGKFISVRHIFLIPDDWVFEIIQKYPQFFSIQGGYLVLESFDQSLAVTARETRMRTKGMKERDRYSFFITVDKNSMTEKRVLARLEAFQKLPFPSPYQRCEGLDIMSAEAQKRAVAVCHEFLSLTVEKQATMNDICAFRSDFRLPPRLEDMLVRYPHIFYVSQKGVSREHVVFLKEAYTGSKIKEVHPMIALKERFLKLMEIGPQMFNTTELPVKESKGKKGTRPELEAGEAEFPGETEFPYHEACLPREVLEAQDLYARERAAWAVSGPVSEPVVVKNDDLTLHQKSHEQSWSLSLPSSSNRIEHDDQAAAEKAKRLADREKLWSQVSANQHHFSYARYKPDEEDDEDDVDSTSFEVLATKLGIGKDEENMEVSEYEPAKVVKDKLDENEEFVIKPMRRFKNVWKNKLYHDKLMEIKKEEQEKEEKMYQERLADMRKANERYLCKQRQRQRQR